MGHMDRIHRHQPGVPVDARAGIPARGGLRSVVHFHSHHIVAAGIQVRGKVVGETDVPERPLPQELAVDPDFAVLVGAIDLDGHLPVFIRRGQAEMLPVPPDSRGREATGASARLGWDEGALDAPIVRQVETAPSGIGETRLLGARCVAFVELPAEVKRVADARRRRGSLASQLAGGVERRNQGCCSYRPAEQSAAGHGIA